jgi:hypothetical protein
MMEDHSLLRMCGNQNFSRANEQQLSPTITAFSAVSAGALRSGKNKYLPLYVDAPKTLNSCKT